MQTVKVGGRGGRNDLNITTAELPLHSHDVNTSAMASRPQDSQAAIIAAAAASADYANANPDQALANNTVSSAGHNIPFDNTAPSLGLTYCVALVGTFPPRM